MSKLHAQLSDLPPAMQEQARKQMPDLYPPLPPPDDGKQTGLERDLQRLCEQELSRRGIWWLHLSPRAREKAGVPDLLFTIWTDMELRPILGNDCREQFGQGWAIELKTATGRLSAEQKTTLERMAQNGWRTAVVRSYEEFREVVFGEAKEG